MVDFIKCLHDFSRDGFEGGLYTACNEHLRFYLVHEDKKTKLSVTICFHTGKPKYHFRLIADTTTVCEKIVEVPEDIPIVIKELRDAIKQA